MKNNIKKLGYTLIALFFVITNANAAWVQTKHGPRQGNVIVREFDRTVVTILTEDNRIFQFYAKDVASITSEENVIVSQKVNVYSQPSATSEQVLSFSVGLEVEPISQSEDKAWTQVKGWGATEGWIPTDILTDSVEFTPENLENRIIQPRLKADEYIPPSTQSETATDSPAAATQPVEINEP